jgi:hypothetical protein
VSLDLFTANKSDFASLNGRFGMEFMANLLWAESRRYGIPVSNISLSYDVSVPDGGIDAQVEGPTKPRGDLIAGGLSCYQIKAGEDFAPQEDSSIRKELFGKKEITKDNLGERVRYCLENHGTYVLVCLHKQLNARQEGNAIKNLKKYFNLCGYHNVSLLIIDQTKIIGILRSYPSLVLALKGINVNFQTHFSWSNSEQMRKEFVLGNELSNKMDNIRESLRNHLSSTHIRVLGDPGIGKTKFTLEATSPQDLSSLVIYCDSPKKFLDSNLLDHTSHNQIMNSQSYS